MLERIDSSRERLEEMADAESLPPVLLLLMGAIPILVLLATLLLTGIIPTPFKDSKAAGLVQAMSQSSNLGKNRAEHTVQDWSQQLGSAITKLQQDTQRIDTQLQQSQDALQAEKAELASLQSMLDGVKKDMTSGQPGNLEVKRGGLELKYKGWQQRHAEFQSILGQLKSSLAQVDSQTASVQQIATQLDNARWSDPLAGAPSPAPGDEQAPLQRYRASADAASKAVPSLEVDDAGYQQAADAVIAEGRKLGVQPKPSEVGAAAGFIGGFADLAGRIPDIAGKPTEPEQKDPKTGETIQHTTKGMFVWRKADNRIAFTDGSRTWVMGPQGLQVRDNNQLFSWEKKPGN